MNVRFGENPDLASWTELVRKVSWNFPGLETEELILEHEKTVARFMEKRQALCATQENTVIGVLLFSRRQNMICCLAVDPDYRRQGIASALMRKALRELDPERPVTVSTFREEDPKGIAPRALYRSFGFREGELTVEFGYPNQVFLLDPQECSGEHGKATGEA